jgi:hypothetical protein
MASMHSQSRQETVIPDSTLRSLILWGTLAGGVFSFGVSIGAARIVVAQKADRTEVQQLRVELEQAVERDKSSLLRIERDIGAVREGVTDLSLRVRAIACATSPNPSACR